MFVESGDHVHSFGWIGVPIEGAQKDMLLSIANKIDKEDLFEEDDDTGIEEDSHVTVLYGVHDKQNFKVKALLGSVLQINGELVGLHIFENERYDVLVVKVESEDLKDLNKKLKDGLKYTNDYPEYKAHATVAYLKSGTGKKYVEDFKKVDCVFDRVFYNNSDNTHNEKIELKKNDIDEMLKGI